MKSLIISSALLCTASFTYGQAVPQTSVPSPIVSSFQRNFPEATDMEWEKQVGGFNVEFEVEDTEHEAWYDGNGRLVRHAADIEADQLPETITAVIQSRFKDYVVDDADQIEAGTTITYRVLIKNNTDRRLLTFTPQGDITDNVPGVDEDND